MSKCPIPRTVRARDIAPLVRVIDSVPVDWAAVGWPLPAFPFGDLRRVPGSEDPPSTRQAATPPRSTEREGALEVTRLLQIRAKL
jgi:hypothetical protein